MIWRINLGEKDVEYRTQDGGQFIVMAIDDWG